MMTHTNQDEDEGADFERKTRNLDAKRKEEVNGALAKTKDSIVFKKSPTMT